MYANFFHSEGLSYVLESEICLKFSKHDKEIEVQRFSADIDKIVLYASLLRSERLNYVPVSEIYRKFS